MKLLIVLSASDFDNFTRRATVEAICHQNPDTTLLFFTGIKGLPIRPPSDKSLRWRHYCTLGTGKGEKYLRGAEVALAGLLWRPFFKSFDTIFLTDPNQELMLNYIGNNQKLIYLIRDPNVLQNPKNTERERVILLKASLVLATSRNLATKYIPKYHQMQHSNVQYWPNCVDLNIWDFKRVVKTKNEKPIIGVAGNFGPRTDFDLIYKIVEERPQYQLELAGKLNTDSLPQYWEELLSKPNVRYLGVIPFIQLPRVVARWDVGIVTDCMDEYTSYMHHNKVYQYLALGLRTVCLRIHNDYEDMKPLILTANNHAEFLESVDEILKEGDLHSPQSKEWANLINQNSSEHRAQFFYSKAIELK